MLTSELVQLYDLKQSLTDAIEIGNHRHRPLIEIALLDRCVASKFLTLHYLSYIARY